MQRAEYRAVFSRLQPPSQCYSGHQTSSELFFVPVRGDLGEVLARNNLFNSYLLFVYMVPTCYTK